MFVSFTYYLRQFDYSSHNYFWDFLLKLSFHMCTSWVRSTPSSCSSCRLFCCRLLPATGNQQLATDQSPPSESWNQRLFFSTGTGNGTGTTTTTAIRLPPITGTGTHFRKRQLLPVALCTLTCPTRLWGCYLQDLYGKALPCHCSALVLVLRHVILWLISQLLRQQQHKPQASNGKSCAGALRVLFSLSL